MKFRLSAILFLLLPAVSFAEMRIRSEIAVDLAMDEIDYVSGERVRGVVDIKNMSPDTISVGYPDSRDRFFVEIYRSKDMSQLERISDAFVAPFELKSDQGLRLEVLLAAHYALSMQGRYLARPVLVHGGMRYEGQYRAFDIVSGTDVKEALQIFSNRKGLSRRFTLKKWTRRNREHLFVSACDEGVSTRIWRTADLGTLMRISDSDIAVSVMTNGEVVVLHRANADFFNRSVFWSLPDALEFRGGHTIADPETAGQSSVQEMMNASGKVKPVDKPWWKFW